MDHSPPIELTAAYHLYLRKADVKACTEAPAWRWELMKNQATEMELTRLVSILTFNTTFPR
jgi:hypothetical protein